MNLPSNFYQYEVNTDLISQMGITVAMYKDEFDKNNNNVQISNLLKDIFSLTQYGKNLFITNSIRNSINQKVGNNKEIENLIYKRNKITTRLDLLMKDIINNPSVTEDKFDNKNKLEIKLNNINNFTYVSIILFQNSITNCSNCNFFSINNLGTKFWRNII